MKALISVTSGPSLNMLNLLNLQNTQNEVYMVNTIISQAKMGAIPCCLCPRPLAALMEPNPP